MNNSIHAISPIDGRYFSKTEELRDYFSEYALIRYRLKVEIQYLIALKEAGLSELTRLTESDVKNLRFVISTFSEVEALKIKEIEKVTNHDVKAVEYYIKDKLGSIGLSKIREFVHFGLTSQDINNTAFPLMMRDAMTDLIMPQLEDLIQQLDAMAQAWSNVPMLARTHGQPASPTTLGKEIYVFVERLQEQLDAIRQIPVKAKFGGATGNLNAHKVTYPDIDWPAFANDFIQRYLGLVRTKTTTQIDHYDNMATIFDAWARVSTILIDLCRDVWTYISMDYFKQQLLKNEVGSSAMPHKVNPIDFENAEGNLGLAIALFKHLSGKLPISRLQRDLTDSTVLRNIGVPFGHLMIAIQSTQKGLKKLLLNQQKLDSDLEQNWAVIAEAIQNILRKVGFPEPYEALKDLTRGKDQIDRKTMHEFVDGLNIEEKWKQYMKQITPSNYTGYTFQK